MGEIVHDPKTKQYIKNKLLEMLYKPVEDILEKRLQDIIIRNTILIKGTHKHFLYKGELYNIDDSPVPRKLYRLSDSLKEEMDDYLAEIKELNQQEVPYVVGYINHVLNSSNAFMDYLKLLPDALHECVKKIASACPCKNDKLSPEAIDAIKTKNKKPIDLMKQRMVINAVI